MARMMRPNTATRTLVCLCALIYLCGVFTGHSYDLLRLGAYAPAEIAGGRGLWQMPVSLFLHVSAWHVAANCVSVWFLGGMVERRIGSWRMLMLYLLGGLAGCLAQVAYAVAMCDAPTRPVCGASGAALALAGALVALKPYRRFRAFGLRLDTRAAVAAYVAAQGLYLFLRPPDALPVAYATHARAALVVRKLPKLSC